MCQCRPSRGWGRTATRKTKAEYAGNQSKTEWEKTVPAENVSLRRLCVPLLAYGSFRVWVRHVTIVKNDGVFCNFRCFQTRDFLPESGSTWPRGWRATFSEQTTIVYLGRTGPNEDFFVRAPFPLCVPIGNEIHPDRRDASIPNRFECIKRLHLCFFSGCPNRKCRSPANEAIFATRLC